MGSQRIGKEKTPKQLCGGVIKEISACDLEPAGRGSGSQVCWLLHDSLWVELNTTNAKYIADVWHVGVRVKANEKGIVTKEEVEGCIREVMEVMEGERGNEMRRNSEKWMKLAKTAVDEGGSSDKNITEFAAELAREFHETKDSKV